MARARGLHALGQNGACDTPFDFQEDSEHFSLLQLFDLSCGRCFNLTLKVLFETFEYFIKSQNSVL